MKNIIYYPFINRIGGIESFIFYLCKKYKDTDITVYHSGGNPEQLQRLSKIVRTKYYAGEKIKCKKAIFNYRTDIIDNVEADEYIQVIHCDFKEATKIGYPPKINPKVTRYIAVTQKAADVFEELTGIKAEVSYNPITLDAPKKILHLISATRLSSEKGKNRMIRLGNILDAAGIPYQWTVFTTDMNAIRNPNIIYREPRLDVVDYIADADYLVQLSDTEGYPYSILEALTVGTPVIVTDLPCLKEMRVENGVNGFVLPFDMSDVPVDAIYAGLPAFEYDSNPDKWAEILAKGKSTYKAERIEIVIVKVEREYFDIQLQKKVTHGEVISCQNSRAEYLIGLGLVSLLDDGSE